MVVAGDVMVEGGEEDLLVSKIYTESRHIKLFTDLYKLLFVNYFYWIAILFI